MVRPGSRPRRSSGVRRGVVAVTLALLAVTGLSLALAGSGGHSARKRASARPATARTPGPARPAPAPRSAGLATRSPAPGSAGKRHRRGRARSSHSSFAVGLRVVRLVEPGRVIHLPGGRVKPRQLVTYVRYPAVGSPSGRDLARAPAARGPFPLVVFGHGFTVTPGIYAKLLRDWARAGYVVAAPVFPLENANPPGGPSESDLINQPEDMRFVISRMLAASAGSTGPFRGLIVPRHVAVAGQSDGGETALAVAYDRHFLDRRVGAAVILSGAKIPGVGGFDFPRGSPPLLATQGTADTVNPPSFTQAFFQAARRPKFLLRLFGAGHLEPYLGQEPQSGIVARVTIAFLNRYLKPGTGSVGRIVALGSVNGISSVRADE